MRGVDGAHCTTPLEVVTLLSPRFARKRQEHLIVVSLLGGHIAGAEVVTKGLVDRTMVHPREIFFPIIRANATAFLIAHNHPAGTPTPSLADDQVTNILSDAGRLLDIPLVDHIILAGSDNHGGWKYYSYRENARLPNVSNPGLYLY